MKQDKTKKKILEKVDFTQNQLPERDYEHYIFQNCDFSNADLSGVFFMECIFISCNLSMADLTKTTLRDVQFKDCKMLGIHFDKCNQFGLSVHFESCILNHSSFYQVNLKKTVFRNASLLETDFTNCDLSNAVFDNCDLAGAAFENTVLEHADFCTAYNYSINPELNRIKKARFSLPGIAGLLDKYDIEIDN